MTTQTSLSAPPHLHEGLFTARMMWTASLCLLPSGVWGVVTFGLRALLVIVISVVSAVVGEIVANLVQRRSTVHDGSAVLSGLLIAYMLPSNVPLYVPIVASLFAMLVIKASFGGLGSNWMNPAVGGQVFAYYSWSGAFFAWGKPHFWPVGEPSGSQSVVSPLHYLSSQVSNSAGRTAHGLAAGMLSSYPTSALGNSVSGWLGGHLGLAIDPHTIDLLVGSVPGSIGAVSILLLALGSIYLFYRRIISWHAPVGFLVGFLLLIWVFGGLPTHRGFFGGSPLFQLLTGGSVLAALFLCTDPVTTPLSGFGMLIFGVGVAILAFLMRTFGSAEEAVFLAILLMNILVPMIDRISERVRLGIN